MKGMAKCCGCLLLAWAAVLPHSGAAQTVLGSACTSFPAVFNQQQSVTLNRAAASGQLIVVGIAVNNASASLASANPIVDSSGNSYPINNAVAMSGGSGLLVAYAGRASAALNVGSSVTVNFFSTGSTLAQSCVEVTAFPGTLPIAFPDDAYGTNSGSASSQAVTASTPSQYASELVYSLFASAATPGTIAALAPAQGLDQTCSSDTTLCLLPAWNLGAPSVGIYEGADASSANAVAWGALLITFQNNDRLFADGFE
jgi:hypothetical protein